MTEPQKTADPPTQPPLVVAIPTVAPTPKTPAPPRRRRPSWVTKPPVIAGGVVILILVEMAAYALLGPLWWAVGNTAVGLLLFAGALAWRRRGKGGLLDRLLARRPGAARRAAAGQHRSGGAAPAGGVRGRLAGLLPGRRGTTNGATGRTPRTRLGKAMAVRRAARAGSASGGVAGGTTGRGGRVRRALGLGPGRKGATTGATGSGATSRGRTFRNPFKGRSATGSSSGTSGAAGKRRSISDRLRGRGRATPSGGAGSGDSRGGRPRTRAAAGRSWARLKKAVAGPPAVKAKPSPVKAADAARRPSPGTQRPTPTPTQGQTPAKPTGQTARPPAPVPAHNEPKHDPPTRGGPIMSGSMFYSDDSSLQRWGATMPAIPEALLQIQAEQRALDERAGVVLSMLAKIVQQGENELPVSNRMMANLDEVVGLARHANTADEWGIAAAQAEGLHGTYMKEHETDEDRLNAPRKSRQHEKRADITQAEQDN